MEQNTAKAYEIILNSNGTGFKFDGVNICSETRFLKGQLLMDWSKKFNLIMEHDDKFFEGRLYKKLSSIKDLLTGVVVSDPDLIYQYVESLYNDIELNSLCFSFASKSQLEMHVNNDKFTINGWDQDEFLIKAMSNILTVIALLLVRSKREDYVRILDTISFKLIEKFKLNKNMLFMENSSVISPLLRAMLRVNPYKNHKILLYVILQKTTKYA